MREFSTAEERANVSARQELLIDSLVERQIALNDGKSSHEAARQQNRLLLHEKEDIKAARRRTTTGEGGCAFHEQRSHPERIWLGRLPVSVPPRRTIPATGTAVEISLPSIKKTWPCDADSRIFKAA